jgi:ectoine hydroxylase-related dioxygenase (phytanoyl-CoA dioxygenase family)
MEIPRFDARTQPEKVAEALSDAGCAIVERLAPVAQLAQVQREIAPHLDATPLGGDAFAGRRTRRTGALIARSPECRELVMHPLVLDVVGRVLGHATNHQLHLTQLIAIGPGEPAQLIHRDQWAFDFFPFPRGYEVQCNTIWAMNDFTEENGATRVVPGSNKLDDKLEFKHEDTVPAVMPAGSVVFYTGSLYHGAGANRSDAVRCGLNLTYALAWLRQEENQYLSVPQEIARTLPDPLLKLMGYARGAYALGYVDDVRDPLDALHGRAGGGRLGDVGDAGARATRVAAGRLGQERRDGKVGPASSIAQSSASRRSSSQT